MIHRHPHQESITAKDSQWFAWICANDPSAGSPTETLLRLLLPLSVEVHQTFRITTFGIQTLRQSELFIGTLNR